MHGTRSRTKKGFSFFGAGTMAARAHSAPARHCARPTTHPAPRGAPGAEGDRSRIRWPPTGVPDKHGEEQKQISALKSGDWGGGGGGPCPPRLRTSSLPPLREGGPSGAIHEKATRSGRYPTLFRERHASGTTITSCGGPSWVRVYTSPGLPGGRLHTPRRTCHKERRAKGIVASELCPSGTSSLAYRTFCP